MPILLSKVPPIATEIEENKMPIAVPGRKLVSVAPLFAEMVPTNFSSTSSFSIYSSVDFKIDWGDGNYITHVITHPITSVDSIVLGDVYLRMPNGNITLVINDAASFNDNFSSVYIRDAKDIRSYDNSFKDMTSLTQYFIISFCKLY